MCESIQGENIKNTQEWECAGKKTASPEVAEESFHGVSLKIMQKLLPGQANDISRNYNSLCMKSIHTLWIKKKLSE